MQKFRVTLWFKKGLLDADQAEDAAMSDDTLHPGAADLLPIEDRYADDGSVTREDRQRLTLATGSTQHLPTLGELIEGDRGDVGDVGALVRDAKRGRNAVLAMMAASLAAIVVLIAFVA